MLTRHRQLFASAIFLFDGMIVAVAWLGAYWMRFHAFGLPAPLGVPPLSQYLWLGAVITPVALIVLRTFRLYRSARTARLSQELITLAQGMAIITALAAVGSFFARGELSRSTLALFGGLGTLGLWGSRVAVRLMLRALRRRGRNLRSVLIVGTGPLAEIVQRKISEHPDYGLVVVGMVGARAEDDSPHAARDFGGVPVIGTVANLSAIVERTNADIVYLALGRAAYEAEEQALHELHDSTAAVRLVPDLARAFTLNASVEDFDGMPIVLVTESPGQGWNAVVKRAFDLVFASLGLVLVSPLLAAIALWVKLDSRGPVLHTQERVGLNGRRFRMHKFRTMRADAESLGAPGWTRPGDPRRTGAGTILRTLSLDELPQLWNVLRGEMSLVGPRPERTAYVEQFRTTVPRYMLRHHVKAGITGWAQINGLRGDTPLERRIEFDLYYIRNWSLGFDLKILFLTAARVFRDANAH